MANYPAAPPALDETSLGTDTLSAAGVADHNTLHTTLADEVNAIAAELGLDPAGSEATVVARLDASDALITTEALQDVAGGLVATGGTKTGITVTYQDATGDMDFVVDNPTESIGIHVSNQTDAITTGTAKVTFRMPYAFTLSEVRASLKTASSSGIPTFDINEAGATILSTKLTVDANETTSTTAATAAVISDSALADDAEMTIDVDVAGTGAVGAIVWLIGTRT